jgi:hypothetical protein
MPVRYCVTPSGTAATCTTTTTDANGRVQVVFTATGKATVQLTATETDTSVAINSSVATVMVRAQATLLRTGPGALTATLAGAAGQMVQLQRFDKTRWVLVTSYRAEPTHILSGLAAGQTYRLVVPATAALSGATSDNVTA